jgi:hypothetical protein
MELLDFLSLGNAAADVEAGEAAKTAAFDEARDTPFTVNEEWAIFWDTDAPDPDFHVSGDLRKLLVSRARRSVLTRLQSTRSQGDIARRMGSKLLAHFDMVRKLGDANLLLYLLLAAIRQLPTPDTVIFPRPQELDYRRSCLHCGTPAISADHVFCCLRVADARLRLRSVVHGNLQLLSSLARSSDLLPDAHVQWLRNHLQDLVWYEPARQPGPPPPAGGRSPPNSSWISARANFRDFDRLCGVLGFLPPGLRPLLCSSPELLGLRERSHKMLLKANNAALRTLSLDLLRGGLAMF